MSGMNWDIRQLGDEAERFTKATEVQSGRDALGIHIESQGNKINVPCAFSVSKEAAVYTLGAGKQGKLGCCDSCPCPNV
jgi:hypothetical protein